MRPTWPTPRVSASLSLRTCQARFEVSARPPETGPATPKQARVRGPGLFAPTNSARMASSESYLPLGKLCCTTTRPRLCPSASNSATLVFVPPMSPAIIILGWRVPFPRSDSKVILHGDRRKHPRRDLGGALEDLVAREDVQLGAQALPLAPRFVGEHATDLLPVAAEPRARFELAFVVPQHDEELVARRRSERERRNHSVAARHVVRRRQHGLDLARSEEHTSELQSRQYLVCRLLLEKKNKT